MDSYDLDAVIGSAAVALGAEDGGYSVKYKNEKFRIGSVPSNQDKQT